MQISSLFLHCHFTKKNMQTFFFLIRRKSVQTVLKATVHTVLRKSEIMYVYLQSAIINFEV